MSHSDFVTDPAGRPAISKQVLARYLRTECDRQLRLALTGTDRDRAAQDMPAEWIRRRGFNVLADQGRQWEFDRIGDLIATFGPAGVPVRHAGTRKRGDVREYVEQAIEKLVAGAAAGQIWVQPTYPVGATFAEALGFASDAYRIQQLRPDLIVVGAPDPLAGALHPDGSVETLTASDPRLRLRVIDVKQTAEPNPGYWAEVTYYAMALAGWLRDTGLAASFVVDPAPALWCGSHDAAHVVKAKRAADQARRDVTAAELRAALELDLEPAPVDVFAPRVRRFFTEDVPRVFQVDWKRLDWGVAPRCAGCEFLGMTWRPEDGEDERDKRHCWPQAEHDKDLCRVPFLSRGARRALLDQTVRDVEDLASRPVSDPVYASHHTLRASRAVTSRRARSLIEQRTETVREGVSRLLLPAWADLRVYMTADFDVGSGITFAFGLKASYQDAPDGEALAGWFRLPKDDRPPRPRSRVLAAPIGPRKPNGHTGEAPRIVRARSTDAEWDELRVLLHDVDAIIRLVAARYRTEREAFERAWPALGGRRENRLRDFALRTFFRPTAQFYLWDELTYDHLVRVVARHLDRLRETGTLKYLAWLFPPPQVVANPELVGHQSPISLVKPCVRAMLAADVPHVYGLLPVARAYAPPDVEDPQRLYHVHWMYEDPLTDQIPSERAHEVWAPSGENRANWTDIVTGVSRAVLTRVRALNGVTKRLELDARQPSDLRAKAATPISALGAPRRMPGVAPWGQLWSAFADLNWQVEALEAEQVRAMTPDEREARLASARLTRRLSGDAEAAALTRAGLRPAPERLVYALAPDSRAVRVKDGDIGLALAPVGWPGFLDTRLGDLVRAGYDLELGVEDRNRFTHKAAGVRVLHVDRETGVLVVENAPRGGPDVRALIAAGVPLNADVMLDPYPSDHFTDRLATTVRKIGRPAAPQPGEAAVLAALDQAPVQAPGKTNPPGDFLWHASRMATEARARAAAGQPAPALSEIEAEVTAALAATGDALNPSQWDAWRAALMRRCTLIWGPPGTGKSTTVEAVLLGLFLEAARTGRPLRVLFTAFTYAAIDNVLAPGAARLRSAMNAGGGRPRLVRLRSASQLEGGAPDGVENVELGGREETDGGRGVHRWLQQSLGPVLVASTTQQVHNLMVAAKGGAMQPLFDVIVIDEASQLDVPHAVLALAALAEGGAVVLAGDPMQLPPVQHAKAPEGAEALVGSVYRFARDRHGVPAQPLAINYRANATLVAIAHAAGYERSLRSARPDLRLTLTDLLPAGDTPPAGWPATLPWSPHYARLLDPAEPVACFVYPDGQSSQWNEFEAQTVAALLRMLAGRLAPSREPTDPPLPAYDVDGAFWERGGGVGVVTPHRAQQGLVVARVQEAFADVLSARGRRLVADAVDTVERFQGQQRDVVIASFGLGDPDMIALEAEFLLGFERFNVLASRPSAKLILLAAREVVDHLAADPDVLRGSRLLKHVVDTFCRPAATLRLPELRRPDAPPGPNESDDGVRWHPGQLRVRG